MSNFAKDIAKLRREMGLSREEAVKLLRSSGVGVSARALAGYERGENEPHDIKARQILDVLASSGGKVASVPREKGGYLRTHSAPVFIWQIGGRQIRFGVYMEVPTDPQVIPGRASIEGEIEIDFEADADTDGT